PCPRRRWRPARAASPTPRTTGGTASATSWNRRRACSRTRRPGRGSRHSSISAAPDSAVISTTHNEEGGYGETSMDLDSKVAVVTGGASGIGRATALLLAEKGARVVCADMDEAGGRALASDAAARGLGVGYIAIDLENPDSVAAFAAAFHQRYGRADILVNAAGWDRIQPFVENTDAFMDKVIEINLGGPVRLARSLLPAMIDGGG